MAKEKVSMLQFIEAHETSENTREVAQKTGMTEASVQARASKLRNDEYKLADKLTDDGKVV